MYDVNDRIFTKKFIDILNYAIDNNYIIINKVKDIKIEVFNDIKINNIKIPYDNFTDLTMDDLASVEIRFSYTPKVINKILKIKINPNI